MFRLYSALLFALVLVCGPAAAESWPEPTAAYRATRTMNAGGTEMGGPLYHDHGKERWEVTVQGMTQVMILRPDLEKMIMVLPQMNMAMEMPFSFRGHMPTPERYAGSEPEVVGQEVVAGEETTKYKVEGNENGTPYQVIFWMTDDGITMRAEGTSTEGSFAMSLSDLERGTQAAELFEAPAGVQVMPANPAMLNQMMPAQ